VTAEWYICFGLQGGENPVETFPADLVSTISMVGVSQEKCGRITKHKVLQCHNKRGCADIKGKCGATTRNEDLAKKNWD
jgi:hypothetical protein